jgi:hypothetical protein
LSTNDRHQSGVAQQGAELEGREAAVATVQERVDDPGVVAAVGVVHERPAQRVGGRQPAHQVPEQPRVAAFAGVQSEELGQPLHQEHPAARVLWIDHQPQDAARAEAAAQARQHRRRIGEVHQHAVALDQVEFAVGPGAFVGEIDRGEAHVAAAVHGAAAFGDREAGAAEVGGEDVGVRVRDREHVRLERAAAGDPDARPRGRWATAAAVPEPADVQFPRVRAWQCGQQRHLRVGPGFVLVLQTLAERRDGGVRGHRNRRSYRQEAVCDCRATDRIRP